MSISAGGAIRTMADCKNGKHVVLNLPDWHRFRGVLDCLVCGRPIPADTTEDKA